MLEARDGGLDGGQRLVGRGDHELGILAQCVHREVARIGRTLAADERAFHGGHEVEARDGEHVKDLRLAEALGVAEREGFLDALGHDRERHVGEQLAGRGGRTGVDGDELVWVGPGAGDLDGEIPDLAIRAAHVDAQLAGAGRTERAHDGCVHIGGNGLCELAGGSRGDRRRVDPRDTGGDNVSFNDGLAHIVRAEERGDDDLGVFDSVLRSRGLCRALVDERLRALGGAVPHGDLVVLQKMTGQFSAHTASP